MYFDGLARLIKFVYGVYGFLVIFLFVRLVLFLLLQRKIYGGDLFLLLPLFYIIYVSLRHYNLLEGINIGAAGILWFGYSSLFSVGIGFLIFSIWIIRKGETEKTE